jgi:hypothetical protein
LNNKNGRAPVTLGGNFSAYGHGECFGVKPLDRGEASLLFDDLIAFIDIYSDN